LISGFSLPLWYLQTLLIAWWDLSNNSYIHIYHLLYSNLH
jgi:hypothetical protein